MRLVFRVYQYKVSFENPMAMTMRGEVNTERLFSGTYASRSVKVSRRRVEASSFGWRGRRQ